MNLKLKSLFADDVSFILDGSIESFETLIDILDNFSYFSALKTKEKPSFANRQHDSK